MGGFLANKAGTVVNGLRAAGIQKTDDLVKEAMLNPGLARVLMMKMTAANQGTIGPALVRALGLIAAQGGAHGAAVVQKSMPATGPMNALAAIGPQTQRSVRGGTMNTEQAVQLELVQLYDGAGQHLGGRYPPLMVENELTLAFHSAKKPQPFAQKLAPDPESQDVALVWMLPLGMTSINQMPRVVPSEMVAAADAKRVVVLHSETERVVQDVAMLVAAFAGGGHA